MEPEAEGAHQRTVGARWWVPWLLGLVVSGTALVVLTAEFPVAVTVIAGFASTLGAAWVSRRRAAARVPRGHWGAAGFSVLLFTGLGLLLGAAGLSSDDGERDNAIPGAVVGGILFAIGSASLVTMALTIRGRRSRSSGPLGDRTDPGPPEG